MLKDASARKVGETAPDGAGLPALHPCPREGGALSDTGPASAKREAGEETGSECAEPCRSELLILIAVWRAGRRGGLPAVSRWGFSSKRCCDKISAINFENRGFEEVYPLGSGRPIGSQTGLTAAKTFYIRSHSEPLEKRPPDVSHGLRRAVS